MDFLERAPRNLFFTGLLLATLPETTTTVHEVNIRKFGTITNALAAVCELTGDIEAVSPEGAA